MFFVVVVFKKIVSSRNTSLKISNWWFCLKIKLLTLRIVKYICQILRNRSPMAATWGPYLARPPIQYYCYWISQRVRIVSSIPNIFNNKLYRGANNPWPFEGTWWSAFRVNVSDLIWDRINCLVIWEWLTALFLNPESMTFDLESIIKQTKHCRPFSCFRGKYSYSVSLSKAKTGH